MLIGSGSGMQFTMRQQRGHGSNVADESWDLGASHVGILNLMFIVFFSRVYVESAPIRKVALWTPCEARQSKLTLSLFTISQR
jgi:hypothetical protein